MLNSWSINYPNAETSFLLLWLKSTKQLISLGLHQEKLNSSINFFYNFLFIDYRSSICSVQKPWKTHKNTKDTLLIIPYPTIIITINILVHFPGYFSVFTCTCQLLPPLTISFHKYRVKSSFHLEMPHEVLPRLKYPSLACCLMIA